MQMSKKVFLPQTASQQHQDDFISLCTISMTRRVETRSLIVTAASQLLSGLLFTVDMNICKKE